MTPYSELTNDELRVAVAEKLEYVHTTIRFDECDRDFDEWTNKSGDKKYRYRLPDFPNSLDACEPVKKWLRERGWYMVTIRHPDMPFNVQLYNFPAYKNAWNESESRALCIAFMEVEE